MRATVDHYTTVRPSEEHHHLENDRQWRLWHEYSDRWEAEHSGNLSHGTNGNRKRILGGERLSQVAPHYQTAAEVADPNMPPVQLLVAGDEYSVSIRVGRFLPPRRYKKK